MARKSLELGKPFEKAVPFSLGVVSSGAMLHTAGITARDASGDVVGAGDMRAQVKQVFDNRVDVVSKNGQLRDRLRFFLRHFARPSGACAID